MKIAIIGEYNPKFRPHAATNEAILHCKENITQLFESKWIATDLIANKLEEIVNTYAGFGSHREVHIGASMVHFKSFNTAVKIIFPRSAPVVDSNTWP